MIGTMRRIVDGLIAIAATLGSIGLVAEAIIILVDVVGRAFGAPLFGSQDLITMVMVAVVFGGMAVCDRIGGHISVDIFERYFSDDLNRMLDALSALLGAVIFLVIAWTVYDSAKLSLMLNLSTNLLNLPKAWFQWILVAFALVSAFSMMVRSVELAVYKSDIRPGKTSPQDLGT